VSQTGSSPVNVGSNTITVRAVNGYRLLRRQVLPTLGSFRSPWRPHGDVVCVLNTRDGGSIQGYRRIGSLLAPIRPWHRALSLEPNATPEFLTPPGQVAFTHEGGKLLVTTKGNTAPSRSSTSTHAGYAGRCSGGCGGRGHDRPEDRGPCDRRRGRTARVPDRRRAPAAGARRLVDAAAQLTALLLFVLGHGGRRHGHQPRA
jgi:hypothetical protein